MRLSQKTQKEHKMVFKFKKIVLVAVCMIATSSLSAYDKDNEVNDNSGINLEKLQEVFFKKGLEQGLDRGRKEGYEMGLKDAITKINEYAENIRAYEDGKYLTANSQITAPRPYQYIDSDGSVRVFVKGCQIEGRLSPKDIIDLSIYTSRPFGSLNTNTNNGNNYGDGDSLFGNNNNNNITNSVAIIKRDTNSMNDANPSLGFKDTQSVLVENSAYYNQRLTEANIPYTLSSNDKLKVILRNKQEGKIFYSEIYK